MGSCRGCSELRTKNPSPLGEGGSRPKVPKEKKIVTLRNRHITLLFLGFFDFNEIKKHLSNLPIMLFDIGPVAEADKCLFLPQKDPRLVAFHVKFFEKNEEIKSFQKSLFTFFKEKNFDLNFFENDFLSHVTICRDQFNQDEWEKSFQKFPLFIKSFNLYESFQNSIYKILWKKDFLKPFEEIHHTADIAYIIKGENFSELLLHAFIALAFKCKNLLNYYTYLEKVDSIDKVIICLNQIFTKAEIDGLHLPFKAVSFHSDIKKEENILNWEMIVDV